jgi:peptidyl-prolyl cis-trans isomerase SurA
MKMPIIKKNIFILFIKSILVLTSFFTIILFFYSAFFYDSHYLKNKIENANKIEQVEKKVNDDSEAKKKENLEEEKKLKNEENEVETNIQKIIKQPEIIIRDGLFATVGNKAITKSDIISEVKKILILNNKSYSESERDNLQNMAIKALIKKNVKKIEVEKLNFLEFNEEDFNKEILRLARNLNVTVEKLKEICEQNGLDFLVVEDQIKTDLRWNGLIFQVYKDRLAINLDEIEDQIKLIQAKKEKEIEEYLVSEIIIKSVEKDKINSAINNLINKIKIEGFENVAMDLSIAETASKGGNLGWISENIINDKLKPIIINTPVGDVSKAVLLPNGILIFKVNDKRKIKINRNIEEIKNQLVNAEKTKILQMHSLSHFNNSRRSISVKFLQ